MSVDPLLLEILVCPKCKGDLEYREARRCDELERQVLRGAETAARNSGTDSRPAKLTAIGCF